MNENPAPPVFQSGDALGELAGRYDPDDRPIAGMSSRMMLLLRSAARKMRDPHGIPLSADEHDAVIRFRRGERDVVVAEPTPAPQPVESSRMMPKSVKDAAEGVCQKVPTCQRPARHRGRCTGVSVTRKNAPASTDADGRRGARPTSAKRATRAAAPAPKPPIHHRVWGFIKRIAGIGVVGLMLVGCAKYGVSGTMAHVVGDWAPVNLPAGCDAKQVAAEEGAGVVVLCADGRVFH